jgi:hypothetical protein
MSHLVYEIYGTWNEESGKKRRYALSGGTTQVSGKSKKVIYVPDAIDDLNQQAFYSIVSSLLHYYQCSTIFERNFLPLCGTIREETDTEVYGDVSALIIQTQKKIIEKAINPYNIQVLVSEWNKKYPYYLETLHQKNI